MDTVTAALRLAVYGLTITFSALLLFRVIIGILTRYTGGEAAPQETPAGAASSSPAPAAAVAADEAEAEVAAVAAALTAMGVTPTSGGRIRIEEISG
jgi:sodium pump decarboxylase gamma subunit